MKTYHGIPPVFDRNSKILILGSFPSVKSRETGFFYGHPQNRFWNVTSRVTGRRNPVTVDDKKRFLLSEGIALWDVIASCDIKGSSDASITDVSPNDIQSVLRECEIACIFCNGKTSFGLYNRFILPVTGREAVCLPSTSPANAAYSIGRLCEEWNIITEYL